MKKRCEICGLTANNLMVCSTPGCTTKRACLCCRTLLGNWKVECRYCTENREAKAHKPWYECRRCGESLCGSCHDHGGLCLDCDYETGNPDHLPEAM